MLIICPQCNDVIKLSREQLEKAEEVLAKMPIGKTLKFKCFACKKPIDLKQEMLSQRAPRVKSPTQPNVKAKLLVEDRTDYETDDKSLGPVYEYKNVYIPVDSVHEGEKLVESFDISPLQKLGKSGWDITAVVPRTLSQTFCNEVEVAFSKKVAYSAACGGNIMGVHFILRRCIA